MPRAVMRFRRSLTFREHALGQELVAPIQFLVTVGEPVMESLILPQEQGPEIEMPNVRIGPQSVNS